MPIIYTREISMLSGDYISFRQPSQAVSSLRQNVANPTQEDWQKGAAIIGPSAATVR